MRSVRKNRAWHRPHLRTRGGLATARSRCSMAGFTVIELLVVLLLVTLTTGLMYESGSFILNLRQRVLAQIERQNADYLRQHWIVATLSGLYPDFDQPYGGIEGARDAFAGLTTAPLNGPLGVPAPFRWSIEPAGDHYDLVYHGGDSNWVIDRWFEAGAYFEYQRHNGDWHRQWPPAQADAEELPLTIAVHVPDGDHMRSWIAHVPTVWVPPRNPEQ